MITDNTTNSSGHVIKNLREELAARQEAVLNAIEAFNRTVAKIPGERIDLVIKTADPENYHHCDGLEPLKAPKLIGKSSPGGKIFDLDKVVEIEIWRQVVFDQS